MQTTFTFKTDKKLRDAAKSTAKKLGIPLTTVINAQLEEFVREGRFEVGLTPRPEKVAEWKRTLEEMRLHPEQQIVLTSAEEIHNYFKKIRRQSSGK